MTKKKQILTVNEDLSDIFAIPKTSRPESDRLTIEKALATVTRQMEISGYRERTISDYNVYVKHFRKTLKIDYIDEITNDSIYDWLASMDVSPQTKLTRVKCLKAFLSRCFDNGWITVRFWKTVKVKVDSNVKEGATENNINALLSVLDLGDFVQLRDATAALLMYRTGIRIKTIAQLENKHIDFEEKLLRLDGAIMKNHEQLLLPFDDVLHRLLTVLIKQNDLIRREYRKDNTYVFITKQGGIIATSPSNNNIQKRLNKYAKQYGLKNINPHALRRGFAKSLLEKGAKITDISRALGHSNLAVTSQYLHLDKEEVAENLRKYL
ncbi:tyrosine-type recombinase/integrase [Bacillus chungangensis]|uniref:Site-specific recombinase XerD n=1 Tax=Bacillus chungangensis TaxID=587633 RepID=A0ABT9WML3_9BACI|nr:site-specific integrase [Bacillus chungangensis]MDQ0174464.1 site-specific recombinase XerD [Bacillus chungangensis]